LAHPIYRTRQKGSHLQPLAEMHAQDCAKWRQLCGDGYARCWALYSVVAKRHFEHNIVHLVTVGAYDLFCVNNLPGTQILCILIVKIHSFYCMVLS